MKIPLVGCASHRVNLAVNHFLSVSPDTNILLIKVNDLMKDLKNWRMLPSYAVLKTRRDLWRYKMIVYMGNANTLYNFRAWDKKKTLLPSHNETQVMRELKDQLKHFQEATLDLQKEFNEVDLYFVRTLFDNLVRKYASCVRHLSKDATIVHS